MQKSSSVSDSEDASSAESSPSIVLVKRVCVLAVPGLRGKNNLVAFIWRCPAWWKLHVVQFVPLIKVMHPLLPWLRLRATCRGMVWPCIVAMAYRVAFERAACPRLALTEVHVQRLQRIRDSGILAQMWLPFSLGRNRLQRRGLIFDNDTLRPAAMAEQYWQELRKRVGHDGHGWIDGKLNL